MHLALHCVWWCHLGVWGAAFLLMRALLYLISPLFSTFFLHSHLVPRYLPWCSASLCYYEPHLVLLFFNLLSICLLFLGPLCYAFIRKDRGVRLVLRENQVCNNTTLTLHFYTSCKWGSPTSLSLLCSLHHHFTTSSLLMNLLFIPPTTLYSSTYSALTLLSDLPLNLYSNSLFVLNNPLLVGS